jgi:hypothetical protein
VRRGVLDHFFNLKGIENQALHERTEQAERMQGEQGERNLN